MSVAIRPAEPGDAPFLAWVALAASRSHVARGAWDLAIEGSDAGRLAFLERLLVSDQEHWCHHRGFLIAEVDGTPAAALAGFPADGSGLVPPEKAIEATARAAGWAGADVREAFRRMAVFLGCLPEDAPGAWVVEWVATRPEFRRRGLVRDLLEAELEEGRRRGHEIAQIMILIGNTPAQRAYERAGFALADEKRSAEFESATGSPGLARLLRPLRAGGPARA